jgi:hypothetical protein
MAAPKGQKQPAKVTKEMIKRARDLKERVGPSNLAEVDNPSRSQIPMQYLCSNSDQQITL